MLSATRARVPWPLTYMWSFVAAVSLAFLCAAHDTNIQDSEVDIGLTRYFYSSTDCPYVRIGVVFCGIEPCCTRLIYSTNCPSGIAI